MTHSDNLPSDSKAIDVPTDDPFWPFEVICSGQRHWSELTEEVKAFQDTFGSPQDGGAD